MGNMAERNPFDISTVLGNVCKKLQFLCVSIWDARQQ
jgi:hypothetical protein